VTSEEKENLTSKGQRSRSLCTKMYKIGFRPLSSSEVDQFMSKTMTNVITGLYMCIVDYWDYYRSSAKMLHFCDIYL